MAAHLGDGDHADFDETRRLLYAALLARRTSRHELAGTLVNALAHHHLTDLPVKDIMTHVVNTIEGSDAEDPPGASDSWVYSQIARITAGRKDHGSA